MKGVNKAKKKVGMEVIPTVAPDCVMLGAVEARARRKYKSLMQDYEELLKETGAKKRRLQKAKQKKLRLLAEVKFLRRKYESLSKHPYEQHSYRLKKQSYKVPIQPTRADASQNPVIQTEIPLNDKNHGVRESGAPSTSAVLDLNQAFFLNGEETEEFQSEHEPLKADKFNRCSVEGEAMAKELKLSICRDVGTSSNRIGKRKISWQDQVALKV